MLFRGVGKAEPDLFLSPFVQFLIYFNQPLE